MTPAMDVTGDQLLARAIAALDAGDHAEAMRQVEAALAVEDVAVEDSAAAHRLLGSLHFMDDRFGAARDHWEAAFRLLKEAGDLCGAARCAASLAMLLTGEGYPAAARGWIERARRLLDRVGPCVEWGYVELAVMACDRTDVDDLLAATERALEIAFRFDDPDLEARAMADSGLAMVSQGRTKEGFARLDAALAAISAGEVEPTAAGICFCSMLTACDRAGDLHRAQEWTAIVRPIVEHRGGRPRALHIHCRIAFGSVLSAAGRWPEAEALMIEALGPHDRPNVSHRDLTAAHLASLRLEQGRVEEAADLLAPFEDRVVACAPLARIHLLRGDPDLAAAVLRRGLNELVGDALRAAVLWALLVQVEAARGDVDAAQAAADGLSAAADAVDLQTVRAEAEVATARVRALRGDTDGSLEAYAAASAALADGVRPLLAGTVNLEVASTHAARGDTPAAVAEGRAALASFERLGASAARDRAAAFLRELGVTPARTSTGVPATDSLTAREREVLALVGAGLTNPEIAERLYISPKTVEHHVGRVFAKLGVRRRAEAAALAVRSGLTPTGSGTD